MKFASIALAISWTPGPLMTQGFRRFKESVMAAPSSKDLPSDLNLDGDVVAVDANTSSVSDAACTSLGLTMAFMMPAPLPGGELVVGAALVYCCPAWLRDKAIEIRDQAKSLYKKAKMKAMPREEREMLKASIKKRLEETLSPEELAARMAEEERNRLIKERDSAKDKIVSRALERMHPWLEYSKLIELKRFWPLVFPVADCGNRIDRALLDLKEQYAWLPSIPCAEEGSEELIPKTLCENKLVGENRDAKPKGFCGKVAQKLESAIDRIKGALSKKTLSREDAVYYRSRFCPRGSGIVRDLTEPFQKKNVAIIDGSAQKCCCPTANATIGVGKGYCQLIANYGPSGCKRTWTSKLKSAVSQIAEKKGNRYSEAACSCLVGSGWHSARHTAFQECLVQPE